MQTKTIGGEQELAHDGRYYGQTNSGRSSLRWLLYSMGLKGKTVLVPDFVCQVVIDILREFNIRVRFYSVLEDLEFSLPNTGLLNDSEAVDALYVVKYFGHVSQALKTVLSQSCLPFIIDDVFGLDVPNITAPVAWGYFNSWRKITVVADYSQVVSNVPLLEINRARLSEFSTLKYKAKRVKAAYLNAGRGKEIDYLNVFSQAEELLDTETGIFLPEDRSVYLAGQYQRNFSTVQAKRQQNLITAKTLFASHQYIDIQSNFPSFLPLKLFQRDYVRHALMQRGIYLAVHWPQIEQSPNVLSDQILSLPLDSRYDTETILRVCALIKELDQ